MKRRLIIHFAILFVFILLTALSRRWLELMYIPYLIGGLLGGILPYTDQLIYAYFLKPNDPASQTASELLQGGNVVEGMNILTTNEGIKRSLIFHTVSFQLIFVAFSFFVVTSSGSLLGYGIVLGFLLHLLIDEFLDWQERGSIDHWFAKIPYELDKKQKRWYMGIMTAILLIFGFLL